MKVIKKLQKLIAHEQSARAIGNTDEAAAFARRIQSLLDKHNLSMSEVQLHAAENSPVDIEPVGDGLSEVEKWQVVLLQNIARINGCYTLLHPAGFQVVIGRQIDRQIVINLYLYFEKLGRELAEKYLKDRELIFSGISSGFFISAVTSSEEKRRNSFLLGFAASVCQRLEKTAKEHAEESQNSAALVFLGNKQKDNQEWIKANVQNVTAEELPKSDIDHAAMRRGVAAGEEIALTDKTLK